MKDFNFPGITWSGGYGRISTPTYGSSLNKVFLDVIDDASLEHLYTYRHTKIVYWISFSSLIQLSRELKYTQDFEVPIAC